MNHCFYYLLPIIGWSIPNFFIKKLRNVFDSVEIIILIQTTYFLFILPALILTYYNDKKRVINFYNKIKTLKPLLFAFLLLIVILGLGAQFGFNSLVKYYDVTHAVPIIRGISSILLVFIGYFIFKENITIKKLLGIISVVFGVYLISSK